MAWTPQLGPNISACDLGLGRLQLGSIVELASGEINNGESDGHADLHRPVFTYYEHVCHAHAAFVPFSQPGGSPIVDLQTLM